MSFPQLSKNEHLVLDQLLKNARLSDSELCERTGLSRSTVSKIRKKLEDEKIISAYVSLPNPRHTVLVFTIYRWTNFSNQEEKDAFENYLKNRREIVTFCKGSGFKGATHLFISNHISMEKYDEMMNDVRTRLKSNGEILDMFISAPEMILRSFQQYLAQLEEPHTKK